MDKQKHFFNLFLGTGLNVLLSAITTPIITRLVLPNDYGQLSLFTMYGSIVSTFILLGQDFAYNRFYYQYTDRDYKKYVLGLTLKWPLFISIVTSIGICAYCIISKQRHSWIIIFAVYIVTMTVDRFSSMTLRLDMKSIIYSFNLNVHKLLYTILIVVAVSLTDIDHVIILTGCTVLAQIASCFIGIIAERDIWRANLFSLKEKKKYSNVLNFKITWKYGWPFIFQSLCAWLFTGADRLMIELFCNSEQLGIYASALSMMGIFSIITTTFTTLWAPMAVEEYENNSGNIEFFVKAADYISVILFFAGICIILFKDLIVYFLGAEYREAAFLIPFLSMCPILYTISESTVYGINFKQKTHWHIVITTSCGILNVVMNFFFINIMGVLGTAVSTAITYTILLIMRTFFSKKYFPVNYHTKKMGVMIVLYYIYAIYSSSHTTTWISVSLFVGSILVSVILYKDSIKDLWGMLVNYIIQIKKKLKGKK